MTSYLCKEFRDRRREITFNTLPQVCSESWCSPTLMCSCLQPRLLCFFPSSTHETGNNRHGQRRFHKHPLITFRKRGKKLYLSTESIHFNASSASAPLIGAWPPDNSMNSTVSPLFPSAMASWRICCSLKSWFRVAR